MIIIAFCLFANNVFIAKNFAFPHTTARVKTLNLCRYCRCEIYDHVLVLILIFKCYNTTLLHMFPFKMPSSYGIHMARSTICIIPTFCLSFPSFWICVCYGIGIFGKYYGNSACSPKPSNVKDDKIIFIQKIWIFIRIPI